MWMKNNDSLVRFISWYLPQKYFTINENINMANINHESLAVFFHINCIDTDWINRADSIAPKHFIGNCITQCKHWLNESF